MTDIEGARPSAESETSITVLVVDDERSNVESLEKIFAREGMRVLVAYDAKRALEDENAKLKKLLAEAELDKSMLKELAEGSNDSAPLMSFAPPPWNAG